jgi:membrane protein YdbS with pleckstrin-like domain
MDFGLLDPGDQNQPAKGNNNLSYNITVPEESNLVDDYNNSTGQASSGQSTLSWIIVLVLVFLGVVIYSFDIDPKWVVILIGVTAVVFSVARLGLMPF